MIVFVDSCRSTEKYEELKIAENENGILSTYNNCVRSSTTESEKFVTSTAEFQTEEIENWKVETRLESI